MRCFELCRAAWANRHDSEITVWAQRSGRIGIIFSLENTINPLSIWKIRKCTNESSFMFCICSLFFLVSLRFSPFAYSLSLAALRNRYNPAFSSRAHGTWWREIKPSNKKKQVLGSFSYLCNKTKIKGKWTYDDNISRLYVWKCAYAAGILGLANGRCQLQCLVFAAFMHFVQLPFPFR